MKKQHNRLLVFSGLAFQIGVLMYLMIRFGLWIESKFLFENKLPTILSSSLGLIIIIYLIQKQSKNLNL
jgi:uncharacterized membrane protein YGL010W